jgi:hypothetical protein
MVTKAITRSFTYHQLLSYYAVSLHGTFTALPRCTVPTNMPKNTSHTRRHGPDPHGERTADNRTFSGRHQVWKTTFQTRRLHRCPERIATEHPGYRNKFCVLYASGSSFESRLLLHIISTQALKKMYGCKFNIKVITDYLLTLLSLT